MGEWGIEVEIEIGIEQEMEHHPLRALLEYLIAPLVDDPERVKLDWVETPKVSLFYLTAERGDLGRILGKGGQTIEDIRKVMEAVAAHHGREVIIDVVELPKPKKRAKRKKRRSKNRKTAQAQAAQNSHPKAGSDGQPKNKNKNKHKNKNKNKNKNQSQNPNKKKGNEGGNGRGGQG